MSGKPVAEDVLELTAEMALPPVWDWQNHVHPLFGRVHLVPLLDIAEHHFDPPCPCGAHLVFPDEGAPRVIHHAFDGREAYEFGGRPRH